MSRVRKGDKVKAKARHSGVAGGAVGTVRAVYSGDYFAVNYPDVAGISYSPAAICEPVTGGSAGAQTAPQPGGTGNPGATPGVAASAWEKLMAVSEELMQS